MKFKSHSSHHQVSAMYSSFICQFFCLGTAQWSRWVSLPHCLSLCWSDSSKMLLFLCLQNSFICNTVCWLAADSPCSHNTLWPLFLQTSCSSYYVYSFPSPRPPHPRFLLEWVLPSSFCRRWSLNSHGTELGPDEQSRSAVYVCDCRATRFHSKHFRRFFSLKTEGITCPCAVVAINHQPETSLSMPAVWQSLYLVCTLQSFCIHEGKRGLWFCGCCCWDRDANC